MFFASQGGPEAEKYLQVALGELASLSERVRRLLALEYSGE
jgi:hypothetical protein